MDVQALTNGPGAPSGADSGTVATAVASPPAGDVSDPGSAPAPAAAQAQPLAPLGGSTLSDAPAPAAAQAPALPPRVAEHSSTLAGVTKTLVGATVTVSYDTISQPNHVITVFKDARTGQTLFKVPPEILIQLGHFFDQVSGAVVDSKA